MSLSPLSPKPATPCATVFSHESDHGVEAAIVVPVLNGAGFLPQSLRSACLQEDVRLEIIVVDDGSRDDTAAVAAEILSSHRDRLARALVIRHDFNTGPAAARDTAMRHATSSAALLLDADNVIYPRCVKRCLQALESSGAAFVYPIVRIFGNRSGLLGVEQFDKERLGTGNYIDTLALVRRSAWETVGGFPDLPEGLEDYAFWLTLVDHGLAGAQIPEILGAYRAHQSCRSRIAHAHAGAIHRRLKAAFPWITVPPCIDLEPAAEP